MLLRMIGSKMSAKRARSGEGLSYLPIEEPKHVKQEDGEEETPGAYDEQDSSSYFKLRCHTYSLLKVIEYWKKDDDYYAACKQEVEKAGFGGLLDLRMPTINKTLLDDLMAAYDFSTDSFIFGEGDNKIVLTITPEDVARVYGLPIGGAEIVVKRCEEKMRKSFQEEVGMAGNRSRNVCLKKLANTATPAEGDRPPVAMAVKQFLLLATGSLLAPTFARICKLDFAEYLCGRVEDIAVYNWSAYVVRELKVKLAAAKRKEPAARAAGKKNLWVLGDVHFLLLHLLDFLSVRGLHTKTIPSCNYWWKQRVEKACLAVPKIDGERYDLAVVLLSREEVTSRSEKQDPKLVEGTIAPAPGASSLAPTPLHITEWWETEDLTILSIDQLKGLMSMTESVIQKWVARRDKVQQIVKNLGQQNNI